MRKTKVATTWALWLMRGVGVGVGVGFAKTEDVSHGAAEFLNAWAVCHGVKGRGDGPLGDILMKGPADLTRKSWSDGGSFPYVRVFAVIGGRYGVPGHGDREMPFRGRLADTTNASIEVDRSFAHKVDASTNIQGV